jgi:hypothetical protein
MKRRLRTTVGVIASIGVALGVLALPAGAAARPFCGLYWGSLPKQIGRGPGFPPSPLVGVRAGRHACFDRLVFDFDGAIAGGAARYVPQVRRIAVDELLPLRGGAFLEVALYAPSYGLDGRPTFSPRDPADIVAVGGFQTFRQVASGGSFEGYTTMGLGVRARLPFRTFVLAGPGSRSRLVVDVAHRW